MLNIPQRKAKATARPVRISPVVIRSVCWKLAAAVTRSAPETQGNSQFRPEPSKIARYVVSGFLPVVTSTTSPPTTNARSAVRIGAMIPSAF